MHYQKIVRLGLILPLILHLATIGSAQQDDPLQQSRDLIQKKQTKEAIAALQAYIRSQADSADAHALLGYAFYEAQDPIHSLEQYTAAAQLRTPTNNDLMAVSADYILLKGYSDAIKWLTVVTERDPTNRLAWYYLGRALYSNSEYEHAVKPFERVLNIDPHDVSAETGLGLVYEALGNDEHAIQLYGNAIEWQKSSAQQDQQPYLRSGVLLEKRGDTQKALELLLQAQQYGENNPLVHEELGRVYEKLGRHKDAQTQVEKAIALDPNAVPLHFLLGKIYREEGMSAEAKVQFDLTSKLVGSKSSAETLNFNLKQ